MIDFSIDAGVGEIVLNAPYKLNSLNEADLIELSAAYDEAALAVDSGAVRALLLHGEGRAFCAGRDIAEVDGSTDDPTAYLQELLTPLLKKISEFPAPTFAAAQGACLGVGLGLLIATDVVYVSENAKFGSPFANLGAALDSGATWLFTERLGAHRTMDLIYTAELMSGAQAVAAGMFSRAKPAEELLGFTREAALKAAIGPTLAFNASKEVLARIQKDSLGLWDAVELENQAQVKLSKTRDYAEGFAAFAAKRKPEFTGQ
ncbi:enoyl-CoA hydratase/isomerase family protein [Arthrobacter cryoconiti]|uniref:Enoyl-CoA hydratase/isomerase family protein n=1 Tax=Arthrobacter cryoconiti TaxID=748907 RepID=A0ABV8R4C3_9MICC|nr:enoyl-CoA hydratase-related protein [Arthrobacter cryoconiti]MCC9068135.1 enoyl-CoA hydratase-related protein [Arthrobacter cryoconiti]